MPISRPANGCIVAVANFTAAWFTSGRPVTYSRDAFGVPAALVGAAGFGCGGVVTGGGSVVVLFAIPVWLCFVLFVPVGVLFCPAFVLFRGEGGDRVGSWFPRENRDRLVE